MCIQGKRKERSHGDCKRPFKQSVAEGTRKDKKERESERLSLYVVTKKPGVDNREENARIASLEVRMGW